MVGQQFTPEQRTFMVLAYHQSGSPSQTRQAFVERFANRRPPDKRTIVRNFQKYQRYATSHNRNKGKSGRPKVARSQQNVDAVRAELTASTRRNNLSHLTKSSFNRIVKFDLKFHPLRMIIRHQLFHGDLQRRINFCNRFQARPARLFERDILIGDDATFRMDGCVNTWNVRSYAARNQPKEKLTVWAGLIGFWDQYFFEGNMTGNTYLAMIDNFVVPNIRGRFEERNNGCLARGWWVQDGAPAHRARAVTARLNELFGNRIVSLGREYEWPPRCTDLTPLDFFLWGYIKGQVYKTPPANVDELRERITNEFAALRRTRIG